MSGLEAIYAGHGLHFAQGAGGVALPQSCGDLPAETAAMTNGAALLPMEGAAVLMVRGPDTPRFLQGIATTDVPKQPDATLAPTLFCGTKGQVAHAADLARIDAAQMLLLPTPGDDGALAAYLETYHIREDLEVGRAPLQRFDLFGPTAGDALRAAGLDPAQVVGHFQGAPALCFPASLGAVPRLVNLVAQPVAEAWLNAMLGPGQARLVGFEAFDETRIRMGVPRFGVDYAAGELPAEAALYDRLAFGKGCYVGQEVHARLHYRGQVNRKLVALRYPAELAEAVRPGAALYAGEEEAAHITSHTRLPVEGHHYAIAMARFKTVQGHAALSLAPGGPANLELGPLSTDMGAQKS